jgi:flagellar biogenesis protein FliO
MDILRQVLAVCVVLALLLGLLWWSRRGASIRVTGWARSKGSGRSLQSVERLTLTPQHALHLVHLRGQRLLIGVHPSGLTLLEKFPAEMDEETTWKEGI